MDAVILAAGRGERLRDLTPAFHKPLLPIDGIPLVCRAVDLALNAGVEWPIVVVAPANAEAISGALGKRDALLIVQREPLGPGHALFVGLHLAQSKRVLVLLSDNVTTDEDVARVAAEETAVGVKYMTRGPDVNRFTRYEDGKWIERVPLMSYYGPDVACWVGPFVGGRGTMFTKLSQLCAINTEVLIGPHLGEFMSSEWKIVPVSSYDVGTLDAYPQGGKIK